MRTSVGRCPRKWSNGCVERWRASRRTDISFIGTISHSLGCKKQRAPLDLRPIAIGLAWPWAENVHRALERKNWLRGRAKNWGARLSRLTGLRLGRTLRRMAARVAGTAGMRKTSLT